MTEDLLMATVARVVDAVEKFVSLIYEEKEPKNVAGPQCRWCSLSESCATGQSYLEEGI